MNGKNKGLMELEDVTYGENENHTRTQSKEPVLADLIIEIEQQILKYIELEDDSLATLLALWVVQTYHIDAFGFCGFMNVRSASPRCGKSRLLEMLGCFTQEVTVLQTMPSPAVLFRTPDQCLFLDEVDGLRNADKERYGEVMSLLNVAFKRNSKVSRCEKSRKGWVVEKYNAYRAIALCGLNKLSDTLADRSFHIQLKRTKKKMSRLNIGRLETEMAPLRNELSLWWASHYEQVKTVYEELPDETRQLKKMDDRCQDISEPLLVLSGVAVQEKESLGKLIMRNFLKAMQLVSARRSPSRVEESLNAFLELIEWKLNNQSETFLSSHELVELCQETEGLQWIKSPRFLSNFLKKFDLSPINQNGKIRGYDFTREWVKEWRERYA